MQSTKFPKPLLVLVGPTAVGKTELSLELAELLDGEIVSADSRLFYQGMDIGTAKPGSAERARVPHHLIDIAKPDEIWNLALFQLKAAETIDEIHHRGKLPLLVGGTGQYVRAVIENWKGSAQSPNLALRSYLSQWVEEIGSTGLHQKLALLDPAAAASIDPKNIRRTIRAMEVTLCTGRRFSAQKERGKSPYSLLLIGLNRSREELYKRIDARIEAMVNGGLLEEVRNLLAQGYDRHLPSMSAIGYNEMAAVLAGEMTFEQAVIQMKRLTRTFVRRQANWFKVNDPSIHWFQADSVSATEIAEYVQSGQGWITPQD